MLSHEIMGALALGILWVNTLLVAGAALGQLRDLVRKLGSLRALRAAAVKEAPAGIFASFAVEQVGRKAADDEARRAILFHDRAHRATVHGGVLEIAGELVSVAGGGGDVWIDRDALAAEALCPSPSSFDQAYGAARKAKGFTRTVEVSLREGDVVHALVDEGRLTLVASFDPRPSLRRKARMLGGFALGMVAITAAITAICLVPPLFGLWSTIGGIFGLVHFLLVLQPLGVAARDAARLPADTPLAGTWVKVGSEGHGAPSPRAQLYAE